MGEKEKRRGLKGGDRGGEGVEGHAKDENRERGRIMRYIYIVYILKSPHGYRTHDAMNTRMQEGQATDENTSTY